MKQYHNYSPEISTSDETQDSVIEEQPAPSEPQSMPRRRNSKRQLNERVSEKTVKTQANYEKEVPQQKKGSVISAFKEWKESIVTRLVIGIILGGLGLWFAVAFVSYFSNCIVDQSMVAETASGVDTTVANDAGKGGAWLTEFLINQGFGVGAVVIVAWLLCMSMKLLIGYPKFRTLDFTIKSLIAFITLSVVVGMVSIGLDTDVNWGGFHGRYINEIIYSYIGWSGAIIISVVLITIFVVICLRDAIKWMLKKKRAYDEKRRIQRETEAAEMQKQEEVEEMKRREIREQAMSGEGEYTEPVNVEQTPAENVEFDPDADTLFDIPDLDDEDDPVSRFDSFREDPDSLAISEEPMEGNAYIDNMPAGVETVKEEMSADKSLTSGGKIDERAEIDGERISEIQTHDDLGEAEEERTEQRQEEENSLSESAAGSIRDLEADIEPSTLKYAAEENEAAVHVEEEQAFNKTKESEGNDTIKGTIETENVKTPGESAEEKKEEEDVMTVNVNQIEKGRTDSGSTFDSSLYTHEYKFPPTDYLRPGTDKISVDAEELLENKQKIRQTLLDFGIPITSIEATVGPTVTLYEIRPDTGVKIAKIRNLVDDLALSLAANGVRIIAPIPGKGTVGIEVANKDAQTVSMRTIIQSKAYQNSKYKLPVALGSTISNEVYIADLAKMPHLLVAGATGQGKSVGLNAIVASLLYSKRPEELKFVMVDPKRVEFSLYSKIEKYYLAKIPDSPQPIITNMENVVATLSSLCVEMDERYMLLEKAFVRQVTEYNDKFKAKKLDPREGHRFMPYIVVIIDEFADLIMTAGKEVELPIARLAQLARAVGIHVIIATQRPSTNVITGMIKANFPVRIAFKVSSGVDSKTILDATGAQQLIGRGDMLISNNGEMTRVQCAFVDTPEVEEVCDYIARQPYPQGPYMLPEPQVGGDGESQEVDAASVGKLDPLFTDVGRQVIMSGTASTSAVQRRYEIGYNRAGRIMDQLEAYGVVGPATGGKPRSVLMEAMAFEDLLATLGLS
ncbi:MAG: DNA translocase FtsK [Muribaculaceae bacterium]|nr:DNA translocase FtsK [Muribaculaceae bacterium]